MINIAIVSAQPSDMLAIRQVQKACWLETYPNPSLGITKADILTRFAGDNTAAGQQQMAERTRRFFQPSATTWVVKDREIIVGYCLAIKGNTANRIQAIYLRAAYQGQGLGKQLITAAQAWLGNSKPIYLNVAAYNSRAIAFYEHLGFVKTGHQPSGEAITFNSGKVLPEIEMVKYVN